MQTSVAMHVMVKRNAREPQHVVRQIEGKQRDQPHEGDEAPTLRIHAVDQSLEEPAGLASDPVSCEVARDQEGKGGAERGTRRFQTLPQIGPNSAPPARAKIAPGTKATVARAKRTT